MDDDPLQYWRAGDVATDDTWCLPGLRRAGPIHNPRVIACTRTIDARLRERLDELAKRESVTVGDIVLAAFGSTLERYGAGSALLVVRSVAVAQRDELELVRLERTDDLPLTDKARRLRDERMQASATRIPATRFPGFPVRIGFFEKASRTTERTRVADAEWTLVMRQRRADMRLSLVFRAQDYDPRVVERVLIDTLAFIEASLRKPKLRSDEIAMLTPDERLRLVDWSTSGRAVDARGDVNALVRAGFALDPQREALRFEDDGITYAELDERANRLANYLQTRGVRSENVVAIVLERSMAMIVAVLAVHRAGGAYVPIEPSYPAERIAYMLEDAHASFVICEEAKSASLPPKGPPRIALDADVDAIAAMSSKLVIAAIDARRLAYIIYTSGSTGRPKGVEVEHRNVVNLIAGVRGLIPIGPGDTLVALASLAFDISVADVYLPLCAGARLVVSSRDTAAHPPALKALLDRVHATHLQATPSTWRMLLDAGWCGRDTMTLISTGEALPQDISDRLVTCGKALWNLYGPTETTIWATADRVHAPGHAVSIGRPLPNVSTFVMNSRGNPLPPGVTGELFVGGRGVARGYVGLPELTAERFPQLPTLFGETERLYRTGDRARYRDDGTIEFLGRTDSQVKVRGHRIELGEVESALADCYGVHAAAATVREHHGEPTVVGYVVPKTGHTLSARTVRARLASRFPSYMVPGAIVVLESLPLSVSGKLDRARLPDPLSERRTADTAAVPPRTDVERRILAIWEDILGVDGIGVTDNFFELGVTSLVVARASARIERELGVALPLSPLFAAPTVERLAALLEQGTPAQRWTSLVPIQPAGDRLPIFCVHGGAGTILHLQPLAARLGVTQPFYGLQMRGLYGDAPIQLNVEEMARHYIAEIRTFAPRGPYIMAGYCFGGMVAYEMAQQLARDGQSVPLLVLLNGARPGYHMTTQEQPASHPHPWRLGRLKARALLAARIVSAASLSALGMPIPAGQREDIIFAVTNVAERLYRPQPYAGRTIAFSAAGLYRSPDLGWSGLVPDLEQEQVPGRHVNERTAMNESHVGFIAERLAAALDGVNAR